MHSFRSFPLQAMFLRFQLFAFKGQNMKLTVKMLFTGILRCYDANVIIAAKCNTNAKCNNNRRKM